MVILWVLSCLALLSGSYVCGAPAIDYIDNADRDSMCGWIAKHAGGGRRALTTRERWEEGIEASPCMNPFIRRNCPIVCSGYEEISTAVVDDAFKDLCKRRINSLANAQVKLSGAPTFSGCVSPDCLPTNSEDFKDEKEEMTADQQVAGQQLTLPPQKNKERKSYKRSAIYIKSP